MTELEENQLDFLSNLPVQGVSLAALMEEAGPLSGADFLRYAMEIGNTLDQAHARGLVHGNLSPHALVDTGAGVHILQPHRYDPRAAAYRSPEQVRGEPADGRSDIFAFGALLYEMASGRRAFSGEGVELDRAILDDAPAPLPPEWETVGAVLSCCLEKNPAARRQRVRNVTIELRFARSKIARLAGVRPLRTVSATTAAKPPAGASTGPSAGYFLAPGESIPVLGENRSWLARLLPRNLLPEGFTLGEESAEAAAAPFTEQPRFRRAGVFLVAGLAAVALLALLYVRPWQREPAVKFSVTPSENTNFPGMPAISPDGHMLTFSALGPEGKPMLWLRSLENDGTRSTPIAGTEGASAPFWSPDGISIGFFADKSLKRVHAVGGPIQTVCETRMIAGGGTWNRDGSILFAPSMQGGLYRVWSDGGTPERVLEPDPVKGEIGFLWPQLLPDMQHFVFFAITSDVETGGVYTGLLTKPEYHLLFPSDTSAVYSPVASARSGTGYLLYIHARSLMGVPFDAEHLKLAGEPAPFAEDIGGVMSLYLSPISVSGNATLVYQQIAKPTRQLVWMDRTGKTIASVKEAGEWGPPRISPDGSLAVAGRLVEKRRDADLWLIDHNGALTRFSSGQSHEGSPVWSPDSSRIAFFMASNVEDRYDIYVNQVRGNGMPELLFRSEFRKRPTDWSRDGRFLFFDGIQGNAKSDVWVLTMSDHHATQVVETVADEAFAALSPDGRWLAFQSDSGGQNEVYVQAFNGASTSTAQRWLVSPGGGGMPRWRGDSKELFYITARGSIMTVSIHPKSDGFQADPPAELFRTNPIPMSWNLFDVAADGQRFLVNTPREWSSSPSINVVTNWTEKPKK